jgi:hypothetical protein
MPRKTKASLAPVPQPPERTAKLSELCADAAEHVAKARLALFDEGTDAEAALAHLDEAISCLKRLLANGRATGLNGSGQTLRSA